MKFPRHAAHHGPVFPAKAGTQIDPERLVGFIWAPAFAGETDKGEGLY
jgi:hypothetical protein